MKILLDENLPHDLRYFLPGHEVFTVAYMGWSGSENGELLTIAGDSGFDVMLTKDFWRRIRAASCRFAGCRGGNGGKDEQAGRYSPSSSGGAISPGKTATKNAGSRWIARGHC